LGRIHVFGPRKDDLVNVVVVAATNSVMTTRGENVSHLSGLYCRWLGFADRCAYEPRIASVTVGVSPSPRPLSSHPLSSFPPSLFVFLPPSRSPPIVLLLLRPIIIIRLHKHTILLLLLLLLHHHRPPPPQTGVPKRKKR